MKIEIRDLSKRFGRQLALDGIDLLFESGSRTALVGPNGSGKSTLIRAIMGAIQGQGSIRFDGASCPDQPALHHAIAYIPQFAPATRATVGDLVEAVCLLRQLPAAQVEACADGLGFDLPAQRGKAVAELSGGMRQKLMISLAMAAPARLLVMDEPTASLDAEARVAFLRLFDRVAADTTVILASHRPDEMRSLVDRLVLLREGKVAYHGSSQAFLADRARTVIELQCAASQEQAPLEALGFRRVHPERWVGIFDHGEKEGVLSALGWQSEAGFHDLVVHEVEQLDLDPEAELNHAD